MSKQPQIRPFIRNTFDGVTGIPEHFISIIQRAVHSGQISSDKGASLILECHKNPELRECIQRWGYVVVPEHLL
jgi:hypothetical protein